VSEPLKLCVVQMAMGTDLNENLGRAEQHVVEAVREGANLVLLPELFSGRYFPQRIEQAPFGLAHPVESSPEVRALQVLARSLSVALPVSFFERDGDRYYNSLAMLDSDGTLLGVYRKSHIPDGDGYEEKSYFSPGETGFKVWETRVGKIGVGICWDQWFPECARAMTLLGADVLLYPTAIGSEPTQSDMDTQPMWRRVMIGHSVANTIPVCAANRVGVEDAITFYGSSFISDVYGNYLQDADRSSELRLHQSFDPEDIRKRRHWFGLLRDRRPGLYGKLTES